MKVVVIPTYNERQNLHNLVDTILSLQIPQLMVLIVDDASPDGTGEVADRMCATYPGKVHVLHRSGKLGLGTAYVAGFKWALEHGARFVLQMDADFSHDPNDIPHLLAGAATHDVVVGSRYVKSGSIDPKWSAWRRFLSQWANSVWARLLAGTRTRDATAGFKCWRASALRAIDIDTIRSNGYIFQVEMCRAAEQHGLSILEVPIFFAERRAGKSKLSIGTKFEAVWRVLQIRMRYRGVAVAASLTQIPD